MVYKGLYHFFYQFNPDGPDFSATNIVWGHSTSQDLINWTPHEPALRPSARDADINGCFSGSATILPNGKPTLLYSGVDSRKNQVQNVAFPKNISDPYLKQWVKLPQNPLIKPTPKNRIDTSSFRDPTTAWLDESDGHWRTVIGSKIKDKGVAVLYKSKDFIHWNISNRLFHSRDRVGMCECPDFYPVSTTSEIGLDTSKLTGFGIKIIFKLSLQDTAHDYYTIGGYDRRKDVYTPDKGSVDNDSGLRYDYGKFYASKSFYDSEKRRRILWAWINESLPQQEYIKQGWSGIQAIPRTIWLDKSGKQLVLWPVEEIESLRTNEVRWQSKLMRGGSMHEIEGVTAAQADVDITFEVSNLEEAEPLLDSNRTNPQLLCTKMDASNRGGIGPFGLKVLASKDLQEYTSVFFIIFRGKDKYLVLMCSDQTRSSLNKKTEKTSYGAFVDVDPLHEKLSLRSLIDHSVVESFGMKGKTCITSRVYPMNAMGSEAHMFVFNNGKRSVKILELKAWSMRKAHIN
ncbi:hypothetical protein LIER_12167 [Lithospermum erythrorhizon]|uniref:Uncharacterized protein n=1 Tax=Lithospermum erythrorhizon TaxID=34254 RepID=A0AAV3PT40_LITER